MKAISSGSRLAIAPSLLLLLFSEIGNAAPPPIPPDPPRYAPGEVAVYAKPSQLPGTAIQKYLPNAGITVISVPRGREADAAQGLRSQGMRAGVNRIMQAFEVPNDPYYDPYQWHLMRIQSAEAWNLTHGEGILVAVADTGLATGGQDGITCVQKAYNAIDPSLSVEDGDGHGTHVSGTIAQTTNNGVGVAGMAYGACIMPVKVLADDGSGTTADIAEGIVYAVDQGAKVINLSLGISALARVTTDPIMDPALDYAHQNDVTVVCAAGNDGYPYNVSYPAIYPTTVAVGATDFGNSITSYSNRGFGLDLVAPGGDTGEDLNGDGYPDGVLQETRLNGAWGYYFLQGTSMAAPHVAATAALLIATQAATTPDEVLARLADTALDLGTIGFDATFGHGLIQAHDALTGGGGSTTCTDIDGDGWCIEDGDCNDTDPTVYPGAPDSRRWWDRNGIDNDCDGLIDR